MTLLRTVCTAAICLSMTGCETTTSSDYFQLGVGNTWEYRVLSGGETGERWTAISDDPDDNDDARSGRGDIFFQMERHYPNPDSDLPDIEIQMRNFNVSEEKTVEGDVLGWQYKDVPADEGDRNEWFLKVPDIADPSYADAWEYDVPGESDSDVDIEVSQAWCQTPVQTSYGTYEDCLEVVRTKTTDHNNGELITTQVREETWAPGYGLIRYKIIAGDEDETEGRLNATSVAPRPGSEE